MIHPDIINASPVLQILTPPVTVDITPEQHDVLLEYLSDSTAFYQLPDIIWTREIIDLIDYLMLPTDKITDYCIAHGPLTGLSKAFRLPSISLVGLDRKDYCRVSAAIGNLDVFKWAKHTSGYWDGRTCTTAAYYGNFEILKWAVAHGCPFTAWKCVDAALCGYLFPSNSESQDQDQDWANENNYPCKGVECVLENKAHEEIMTWLVDM